MRGIIKQPQPRFNSFTSIPADFRQIAKSNNTTCCDFSLVLTQNSRTTYPMIENKPANQQPLAAVCNKFKLRGNEVLIFECLTLLSDLNGFCESHIGTIIEKYQERFGATISYNATASILKRIAQKGLLKIKQRGCGLSNIYELLGAN